MYVPDFLSREEQCLAVHAIEATPSNRWVSAGERRMQNWGGKPGACTLAEVSRLQRCYLRICICQRHTDHGLFETTQEY